MKTSPTNNDKKSILSYSARRMGIAESAGRMVMAILVGTLTLLMLNSCSTHDDDAYDSMPAKVKNFVAHYFPGYGVESYTVTGNISHVRLSNGPGITFDKDLNLEGVNGYGSPLPQVMLFDMLPPALFDYLQSNEELNQVFAMTFTPTQVIVELLESRLTYDVKTTSITRTFVTTD